MFASFINHSLSAIMHLVSTQPVWLLIVAILGVLFMRRIARFFFRISLGIGLALLVGFLLLHGLL